jgi:hypothetical protein
MSPLTDMAPGRLVGDLDIQEWIHHRFGFVPHPFWISHCRQLYLQGPIEESRQPWHECPPDKRPAIKAAFLYFGILKDGD